MRSGASFSSLKFSVVFTSKALDVGGVVRSEGNEKTVVRLKLLVVSSLFHLLRPCRSQCA